MNCDNCGQKPAKVHMTEIINENEKAERHLCEGCAEKLGYAMKQHFSISELLAGLAAGGEQQSPDLKCQSCGMNFAEFQNTGRFGCSEEYDAFSEHVAPRIERYHDAKQHIGKTPRRADHSQQRSAKLRSLRSRLKEAVAQEAYEEAAGIRDQIKGLEDQTSLGDLTV